VQYDLSLRVMGPRLREDDGINFSSTLSVDDKV
jgi:hypothetical protein